MYADANGTHDTASVRFEARALLHLDSLFNRALDLTGSREEAGALVKETYRRAARAFANNGPENPTRAWLFSILFSIHANEYRGPRRREGLDPMYVAGLESGGDFRDDGESVSFPESEAAWSQVGVAALLDRLPDELRGPLVLVDVDQLAQEDSAKVLRSSVTTVRARLFRARHALIALLDEGLRNMGRVSGRGF